MAWTEAFHRNGLGSALEVSRHSLIARINSGTLSKLSWRTRFSVSSRNHRPTRFSHDELVGVKWSMNRAWLANHARTLVSVWAP